MRLLFPAGYGHRHNAIGPLRGRLTGARANAKLACLRRANGLTVRRIQGRRGGAQDPAVAYAARIANCESDSVGARSWADPIVSGRPPGGLAGVRYVANRIAQSAASQRQKRSSAASASSAQDASKCGTGT